MASVEAEAEGSNSPLAPCTSPRSQLNLQWMFVIPSLAVRSCGGVRGGGLSRAAGRERGNSEKGRGIEASRESAEDLVSMKAEGSIGERGKGRGLRRRRLRGL